MFCELFEIDIGWMYIDFKMVKGGRSMSNIAFDFLTESLLFRDDYLANDFSSISDKELILELRKYREHVMQNLNRIIQEISHNHDVTNVAIETFKKLPSEDKLKQLALYMNQIVVGDPLFRETDEKENLHGTMSKFMGLNPGVELDRKRISNAAYYMKNCTYLVVSQFIKFLPVSLLNEAPHDLPIVYSENNFCDAFPRELYEWFHKNARVHNIEKIDGKMRCDPSKPLSLGTTIHVDFGTECLSSGMIFQFARSSEVGKMNPNSHEVNFRLHIPDTISRNDFEAWIENAINRASIRVYNDIFNELSFAKQVNCMYLTESPFSSHLIKSAVPTQNPKTDIANLSMKLELPLFSQLSLNEIINIRCNYGEAFQNFRNMLAGKLIVLRGINDPEELKRNLENVSYELSELQIHDIDKEYKKIVRSFGFDGLLLTGSLITSFCTGGLTMLGAAGAVAKSGVDYTKYLSKVKENDGFFLWKVNRVAKK